MAKKARNKSESKVRQPVEGTGHSRQKCVECESKAVISLSYGPHRFCKKHFLHFFEKRVRRTIRENRLVEGREKIVAAYSGGKDSGTTLFILKNIFGKSNPIEALLVDEGISGYRDKALDIAEKNCKKWKVPFKRVSFAEEFGFTMVDVMRKTGAKKEIGSTCAYCGVLRRQLLNKHAKKMGAAKIATGHNLDDEAQSVLMNVCDADLLHFARLGPKSPGTGGMVPRIKPLCLCPENEVISFAQFAGIMHYSGQCCPFKWQAKRNDFRGILNHLEASYPGTMFSIMRFFQQVKPLAFEKLGKKELFSCEKCGEPSSEKECKACKMAERIAGKG